RGTLVWRNDRDAGPTGLRLVALKPGPGVFEADPPGVASPHAVEKIIEAERGADLDGVVRTEAYRDSGGRLWPRRQRVVDRRQRFDRAAAELVGVPSVYCRLVARFPRHPGQALAEALGDPVIVAAAQVVGVKEGDIHVTDPLGREA